MKRDPECIFCKIVAAQVPAHVVYEDQSTIAFLDVGPLSEGHLLLVPREHYAKLSDLPAELAADLGSRIPLLGRALMKVASASAFNVLCNEGAEAGQVVHHVHFHLIPRRAADQLGYRWNAGSYPAGRAADFASEYQRAISSHGS